MYNIWTMRFWIGSFLAVFFLLLSTTAYAQTFIFNGVKFGLPINEQDSISLRDANKFDDQGFEIWALRDGALPDIGIKMDRIHLRLYDNLVESLSMCFPTGDYTMLLDMLTEKYGKPKVGKVEVVKTISGASFKQHVVMWSLPKAKILLGNIGYDVTRGLLTVTTMKGSKFMEEKEKKDKQKYKGNL